MCNESFGKNESKYNSHVQERHNFPCKYCGLKFTYENGRRDHEDSEHQEEATAARAEAFECKLCKAKFTRPGAHKVHEAKEHGVQCDLCEMSFTSEVFCETHMQQVHGTPSSPPLKRAKMSGGQASKSSNVKKDTSGGSKMSKVKSEKESKPKMKVAKESSAKGKVAKKEAEPAREDDTICEMCMQQFTNFEAFERHIEQEHSLPCPFNRTCELSFVHK